MLGMDPNYRSLPEQVDFLTEKQEEQETINSNQEQNNIAQQNSINNLGIRQTTSENKITNLEETVAQHTEDISNLNSEVEAVAGKGGYLIPYNFGTATPTEQQLNNYALSQIPNITQPEEIFNGTRVTNLYNNHTWILNNTQDTTPVVFEWVDLGQTLVSIANNETLGVVKSSPADFKVSVDNNGIMSVNGIVNALNGKQDKLTLNEVQSGTIDQSIGFDSLGNVVRGSAGGGGGTTQLYKHALQFFMTDPTSDPNNPLTYTIKLNLINTSSTQITSYNLLNQNASKIINGVIDGDDPNGVDVYIVIGVDYGIPITLQTVFSDVGELIMVPIELISEEITTITDTVTQL